MKIAIVFYGQPRDYLKGYANIMNFMKNQECDFDFFYHCWSLNENQSYEHSPWRNIQTSIYKESIMEELKGLYNPISYEIENQSLIKFDTTYLNTIAYRNTKGLKLKNINNILYQLYSRNKSRNILHAYLLNHKVHYDFVLFTRFDIGIMPQLKLSELDKTKTYVSDILLPRKIIPDNCILTPTPIFLKWGAIYENLQFLLNNKLLEERVRMLNENLEINAEELIFASYILHYGNTDNILYFKGGNLN